MKCAEAYFSQKMFTNGINGLNKVKIVIKMKSD